jgi:hypothetical protein
LLGIRNNFQDPLLIEDEDEQIVVGSSKPSSGDSCSIGRGGGIAFDLPPPSHLDSTLNMVEEVV